MNVGAGNVFDPYDTLGYSNERNLRAAGAQYVPRERKPVYARVHSDADDS